MIINNVYIPNLILLCLMVLCLGIAIGITIESRFKRKKRGNTK